MTKYTDAEIKEIIKENRRLKAENSSIQKILSSRRFRLAEKAGNMYNQAFPVGSVRRKAIRAINTPIRKISELKKQRQAKAIQKIINQHNKIFVIHSIPWNTPLKQRPHHLAKCLANEGFLVIYLEPDEAITSFRKISDRLITINSWGTLFNIKLNKKNRNYFLFNNVSNISVDVIKEVKKHGFSLLYEYIDEFHEDIAGSITNQLKIWENLPKLRPTLVLASAKKLYKEAKEHLPGNEILLSKNAVIVEDFDYHAFGNAEVPEDLAPILSQKRPIVGYYGALAPWLDYELISQTAKNNPRINFVLIGVNYQNALSKLDTSIKNIHYLGPKKYTELPKYSCFFDCAIIPFGTGRIAKGTSPVKLFEYMAMGLPVVCTKDLKECEGYECVYLAQDYNEFSKYIEQGISEHHEESAREKLLQQAKQNSWQSRANDIKDALMKEEYETNH